MNPNHTNKVKLPLLAAATLFLSACSSGPSENDAESAVQRTLLGACPHLELADFTKTNGIPITDRDYRVEVKYTVRLESTSDMQKYVEQVLSELANVDSELEIKRANAKQYQDDRQAFIDAGGDWSVFERKNADRFYQWQRDEVAIRQYEGIKSDGPNQVRWNLQSRLKKDCPGVGKEILRAFFSSDTPLETYEDDVVREFTGTIHMVETDNGWQESR